MLTLLTWIVIAFIIAIIFGIIKVEDVKAFTSKWTPKVKKLFFQITEIASKKAAEIKVAAEKNKDKNDSDNNSAE